MHVQSALCSFVLLLVVNCVLIYTIEIETCVCLGGGDRTSHMSEAVCEDPLYRRKMAFYSLPKTGHDPISSQDQLNMKFMTRIQILEYYPEKSAYRWEFCLHFQRTSLFLFTWWTFNLSSPVLVLPPFLFPSHPPRTQSNSQWSSLETNSRRKMQWSCLSWFCSTWETANLRYVVTSSGTMFSFFSLLLCGCYV